MGDFTIIKGDSYYISVTLVDEDNNTVDFQQGDVLTFSVKKKLKQPEYDIQVKNIVTTEGDTIIEITPHDTNIREGNYYYDIEYKDTNADVYTLVRGILTIDWEVTQNE